MPCSECFVYSGGKHGEAGGAVDGTAYIFCHRPSIVADGGGGWDEGGFEVCQYSRYTLLPAICFPSWCSAGKSLLYRTPRPRQDLQRSLSFCQRPSTNYINGFNRILTHHAIMYFKKIQLQIWIQGALLFGIILERSYGICMKLGLCSRTKSPTRHNKDGK